MAQPTTEGLQGLFSFPWVTGEPGADSMVGQHYRASICSGKVQL